MRTKQLRFCTVPFRYGGGESGRQMMARLRYLHEVYGVRGRTYRIRRRTLFRAATPGAVAAALREIRDQGSLFTAGQVRELEVNHRAELPPGAIVPFTRPLVVYHVEDVRLRLVPTFSLTLAPGNIMPVIAASLWLRGEAPLVGGFIDTVRGGISAMRKIRGLLGVEDAEG